MADDLTDAVTSSEQSLRHTSDATWERRRAAVRSLGEKIDRPDAFAQLVAALDDEDLGVVEVAVEVLAMHGGDAGMSALARSYAANEDSATYAINDRLVLLSLDHDLPVVARLEVVLRDATDAETRRGAQELLHRLPPDHF